ncbi:MAG: HAMP domain-containing sensor histidine kinase [Myxococcota bacterium]
MAEEDTEPYGVDLADLVARVREAERLKSGLLARVSHELRTPLTSVIGYSEMLLEGLAGPLGEGQREYVHVILEKGEQLLETINALLELSRVDAGGIALEVETVDVAALVELCAATVRARAARKRLTLRIETAPIAILTQADREKLRQVLLHLLGNAIKFTPDGGEVAVGAAPGCPSDGRGAGVRLWVRDNGVGVAADLQSRIFEAFFQADGSSTRAFGGTGLGLAVVKAFVEAHRGSVRVESEAGGGSTFHVLLPAAG